MKNYIYLSLIFAVVLASCSKETVPLENPESSYLFNSAKLMVFDSDQDFKDTLELFNSFESVDDYVNWGNLQKHSSLYQSDQDNQQIMDEIPFTFLFLMNQNKEFQIGNSLITYRAGVFYKNTIDDNGNVDNQDAIFAEVENSSIPVIVDDSNDVPGKVLINANGGEYKTGWEEYVRVSYRTKCGTPYNKSLRYRLVHYLVVQKTTGPLFTQSDLLFKLRMSQKTGSGWKYNNTTTERLYALNLSGNWVLKNKYSGIPFTSVTSININNSNTCFNPLKGTKSYWLGNYNFVTGSNLSNSVWDINLSGTVFHKVNGDVNELNKYINW